MSNKLLAKRYRLSKHIGRGGMAEVYVAVDTILNREVAVKILHGDLCNDPISLLRFKREAQASCALVHPNIVEIYDVGEDEGQHFIVMEYIRGKTLKQLTLTRGALSKEEALDVMKQLVSAISTAHKKGIIHRDIKPQNVLVKDDGSIKVVDFGIALAHDAMQLTNSDSILGSVHYLAPEIARGENATVQSDIYSLGIVLFELLSGDVPYKGDSPVQIALRHMRDELPELKTLIPQLPQSIENIVTKATVKKKEYRYTSAAQMLIDVENALLPHKITEPKLKFAYEEALGDPTRVVSKNETVKTQEVKKVIAPTPKTTPKRKNHARTVYAGFLWVILTVVGIFGVFVVLYFSTDLFKQERLAIVPSCEGKTITQCEELIVDTGITIDRSDIVYELTDNTEEGIIISTYPVAESEVELGSSMALTISLGKYEVMQNYVGLNNKDAQDLIEQTYDNVSVKIQAVDDSGLEPGTVIEQQLILPDEKFSPTERKEVRLLYASYPNFQVPTHLLNMDIHEAESLLSQLGAKVIFSALEVPNGNYEGLIQGVVVRCDPSLGSWYTQEESNYITIYYY